MSSARLCGALLLQSALLQASYAAVRPMVSYKGIELGLSNTDLVLLVASFSALPLLAAFFVGRMADRLGPSALMVAGAGIALVSNLLAVGAAGLTPMLTASMFLGLGHMTCVVGQQVAVATMLTGSRDRSFGWLSATGALGQVLGPPSAAFVADMWDGGLGLSDASAGLTAASLLAGLGLAVTCLLGRGTAAARTPTTTKPSRAVAEILSTPGMWAAMLLSGVTLAALDLVSALLPLWGESRGIGITAVGLLLGLRGAVTLVSRLAIHRLVITLGRRPVLVLSAIGSALALAVLPWAGLIGATVAIMVLGLGFGTIPPLTAAWVSTAVNSALAGGALGLRLSANRALQVAIPVALGTAATGRISTIFLGTSLFMLAAGAAGARIPTDRGK